MKVWALAGYGDWPKSLLMTLWGTSGSTAVTWLTILSSSEEAGLPKAEGSNSEGGMMGPLGTKLVRGGPVVMWGGIFLSWWHHLEIFTFEPFCDILLCELSGSEFECSSDTLLHTLGKLYSFLFLRIKDWEKPRECMSHDQSQALVQTALLDMEDGNGCK